MQVKITLWLCLLSAFIITSKRGTFFFSFSFFFFKAGKAVKKKYPESLDRIECSVTLNESSTVVGQINLNHLTWQRRSGKLIIVIIALQLLRLTAALWNHQ